MGSRPTTRSRSWGCAATSCCSPVAQAIHDEWGPAFDLSSLAGLLFLGCSGMAAAAKHAPGLDGRRRFVGFIDADTARVAALSNRIPSLVVDVQIGGRALAMGAFGFYLGLLDRGVGTGLLAAGLVVLILLAVLDLDRPTRGIVEVPATPLTNTRAAMATDPATGGPIRT
jgi:hypothetical protein